MQIDLLIFGVSAWLAAILSLAGRWARLARALAVVGAATILILTIGLLPGSSRLLEFPFGMGKSDFQLTPDALWLLGFGLPGAILALWLGTPAPRPHGWIFGAVFSLIGALGVFGLQDAASFLIAWELMSLGGAVMILSEGLAPDRGLSVLFMLGLLEAGSVALMLAFVLLAAKSGGLSFADFAAAAHAMPPAAQCGIGLLFLIGFGAKLGLLPFYEWFPGAYGAGSGATGALLSGVILNAGFFGLSRALLQWVPVMSLPVSVTGIFVIAVAVLSAIVTALYAFQQNGWRELLSLSSAENGSIAVCLLGVSLMFRHDGLTDLAALAWTVALLHMAGHALAKSALFLAADGVYRATGDYALVQRGILARSSWMFGIGALFSVMSLAAMPPQAGFVSEWYMFQTIFQGFHLISLASRLTAALAGAGLALTAAVALATAVKLFGIGLLGRAARGISSVPRGNAVAVAILGSLVLVLAAGMPAWLQALSGAAIDYFASNAIARMHDGWLLVPLSANFAFISPSMLVFAMPILAVLPAGLLILSLRRRARVVPVWNGGRIQNPIGATTTSLTFSNALRTFYSFIYRPTVVTEREHTEAGNGQPYFTKKLIFSHDIAPIFGPYLFHPLEDLINTASEKIKIIQSGYLNLYLFLIGILLVIILAISFF